MIWLAIAAVILLLMGAAFAFVPVGVQIELQGRGEPSGHWLLGGGVEVGVPIRGRLRATIVASGAAAHQVPPVLQLHVFGRQLWQGTPADVRKRLTRKRESAEETGDELGLLEQYERLERWLDPVELLRWALYESRRVHIDRLELFLRYSFQDVALTGKLLGALYVLDAVLPPPVQIRQEPSWESVDKATLGLTGALWFRPGVLLFELMIYLLKNIKLRRAKEPPEPPDPEQLAPGAPHETPEVDPSEHKLELP